MIGIDLLKLILDLRFLRKKNTLKEEIDKLKKKGKR